MTAESHCLLVCSSNELLSTAAVTFVCPMTTQMKLETPYG